MCFNILYIFKKNLQIESVRGNTYARVLLGNFVFFLRNSDLFLCNYASIRKGLADVLKLTPLDVLN